MAMTAIVTGVQYFNVQAGTYEITVTFIATADDEGGNIGDTAFIQTADLAPVGGLRAVVAAAVEDKVLNTYSVTLDNVLFMDFELVGL